MIDNSITLLFSNLEQCIPESRTENITNIDEQMCKEKKFGKLDVV